MKSFLTSLFILFTVGVFAQLKVPQPSPFSTVKQVVGLTDVEVAYSRPSAKGRKVFGDLVPFDQIWRTGANKATQLSFSTEVTINNTKIAAGNYSLFTIPGKGEWTIIINKETELWGTDGLDETMNVVKFKTKANSLGDKVETFTINFKNLTATGAEISISWENTEVSFGISVDSEAAAWASIESEIKAAESSWKVYYRAADYAANTGKNLDQALEWTKKALEIEEYWYTYNVQSKVYAAMGDYKNAIKSLQKSIDLGKKIEGWGYADMLNKQMEDYKSKSK